MLGLSLAPSPARSSISSSWTARLGGYIFTTSPSDLCHCVLIDLKEGPYPELDLCTNHTYLHLVVTFSPGSDARC